MALVDIERTVLEPIRQKFDTTNQEIESRKRRALNATGRWILNEADRRGYIDQFGQQVQENLPKITQVRWASPQAEAKFVNLVAQGGIPEGYAGHFVHVDANFMAEGFAFMQATAIAHGLEGKLTRAIEPIAISVANGKQDRLMERMYPYMEAHAAARNVTFFWTTRIQDTDRYGDEKPKGEADPFKEFFDEPGSAALLLPFGSIQAGRRDKNGSIFGLKELYHPITGEPIKDLIRVFTLMESKGRWRGERPFFQPATIRRSYLAQSPDTLKPALYGSVSLFDWPSTVLSYFGFSRLVVEVILGTPVTRDDMRAEIGPDWKKRVPETNRFLMQRVALQQLPEEMGEFSYLLK